MPELPEVETTRRGVAPHVLQRKIAAVEVRQGQLRWPISAEISSLLPGRCFTSLSRRGKYLLFESGDSGTMILHLGMSGSLRVVSTEVPPAKHDHFDVRFDSGVVLRFTDPRRFGAILWTPKPISEHPLLKHLGPEPLTPAFNADYLFGRMQGKRAPIKQAIMDSRVVVGVGNIYANEALFAAGIAPNRMAGRISRARYQKLTDSIKQVLQDAIAKGGTTLRDFLGGDGKPGYFQQQLKVYGRAGEACMNCSSPLRELRLGQRSTVFCSRCQR